MSGRRSDTRTRRGQSTSAASVPSPAATTKQNYAKTRRRGASIVEETKDGSPKRVEQGTRKEDNNGEPAAKKQCLDREPNKTPDVEVRRPSPATRPLNRFTRQARTETPDKGDTDDPEPKSTPSSSRPPSSLSVSTAPSSSTTPTPPNPIQNIGAMDSPAERAFETAVIKSPNDDDIRAIAKPPKKRKTVDESDLETMSVSCVPNKRCLIDLKVWINQRVLARKDFTFQSGIIKNTIENRNIGVLFDGDTDIVYFNEVLDRDRKTCDIISDYPPPAVMISINCRVCVRINTLNVFYEGEIVEKRTQPSVMFRVRLHHSIHIDQFGLDVWIPRAHVRLLQPPWYEDLDDAAAAPDTPVTPQMPIQPHYHIQVLLNSKHEVQWGRATQSDEAEVLAMGEKDEMQKRMTEKTTKQPTQPPPAKKQRAKPVPTPKPAPQTKSKPKVVPAKRARVKVDKPAAAVIFRGRIPETVILPAPVTVIPPAPLTVDPHALVTVDPPALVTVDPPTHVTVDPPAPVTVDPPSLVTIDPPASITIDPPALVTFGPPAPVTVDPPTPITIDPPVLVTVDPPAPVTVDPPALVTVDPPASVDPPAPVTVDPSSSFHIDPPLTVDPPALVTVDPPAPVTVDPPALVTVDPPAPVTVDPPALVTVDPSSPFHIDPLQPLTVDPPALVTVDPPALVTVDPPAPVTVDPPAFVTVDPPAPVTVDPSSPFHIDPLPPLTVDPPALVNVDPPASVVPPAPVTVDPSSPFHIDPLPPLTVDDQPTPLGTLIGTPRQGAKRLEVVAKRQEQIIGSIARLEHKLDLLLEMVSQQKSGGARPELQQLGNIENVPVEGRIDQHKLNAMKNTASSVGNFSLKAVQLIFPELFGPDNLRLLYSFNGGGVKGKRELPQPRRDAVTTYVRHFYPEVNTPALFSKLVINSINEGLRRPVVRSRKRADEDLFDGTEMDDIDDYVFRVGNVFGLQ